MKLILASASPRRAEILTKVGLKFSVCVVNVDEAVAVESNPANLVSSLALRKAQAVANTMSSGLVLGADTVVVLDNEVLGKPASPAEAEQMLHRLSGRVHRVFTGVALIDKVQSRTLMAVETTRVYFRPLSVLEIKAYVATGEPMDKAGAYGIQEKGAVLVERIEGCYFNVVGLPVVKVIQMLSQLGFNLYQHWS
ncbi:MAG: septum formation inhibitor Maf [Syntrophomonadaceae bacterium]|nr:septum formation inhibitor Maf [Syntrophomonadaceae bacterium]